ncbi:mCG1036317 [Mus musculus]|nr:mCG1036317 [Mus musculus]
MRIRTGTVFLRQNMSKRIQRTVGQNLLRQSSGTRIPHRR